MYTNEEIDNIKRNLTKIHAYVADVYAPRLLRPHEAVDVQFGRNDSGGTMSFGFYADGSAYFRTGGLTLDFSPASRSNVYTSYSYVTPLLLNWKQVKLLIEEELNKRDRERKALAEFEV